MECLTHIPFVLDAPALMAQAHVRPGTDDAKEFEALVATARDIAKPKAVYKEAYVEARGDESVRIDGITFTSRASRKNLAEAERVFAFVATCGQEIDEMSSAAPDILGQFWCDAIKASLLNAATTHLKDHLDRRFQLGKTSVMNPGSGDASVWPIEQQRELFALLGDVEGQIGVHLTHSFLMMPNKTVSGIRFPTEKDFRSCQVCRREHCSSRSAPFDTDLWESIQSDNYVRTDR